MKQFSIEIAVLDPKTNDWIYANLKLPAKAHEIQDALQRARITDKNTHREYTVYECSALPIISGQRLDSPSIEELNFFAKRLDSLNEDERLILRAVAPKYISTDEEAIVSVKDLINLTYGLEKVMIIANVRNTEQLGEFIIGNELCSITDDIPEDILPYLDRDKIGRIQQESDGSVFVDDHCIVTSDYELKEVYNGKQLPNEDLSSRYAFRLEIGRPPVSDADIINAVDNAQWIELPIDKERANAIAREYGKERIEDCVYFGFESTIPQIEQSNFGDMQSFDKLNALSQILLEMPPSDQAKFKAILSAESPSEIEDMLDVARNLHQYEFMPRIVNAPQFFKDYMLRHLDTRFDPKWLDSLWCYNEGDRLLQRLGATVTDYGVISKRCGSLQETVTRDIPEKSPLLNEKFELIEIHDQIALFTNGRLKASDVPDGLYRYHLRSSETMAHATIESKVLVNLAASILVKQPFDFDGSDHISLNDDTAPNFLGAEVTVKEFMETDYTPTEEQTIKLGGTQT